MECEFPTVNSNQEEIKEIFDTVKTIAVLGLSPDPTKASHRVAKYLQEAGYRIVPVYPKEETILGGERCTVHLQRSFSRSTWWRFSENPQPSMPLRTPASNVVT